MVGTKFKNLCSYAEKKAKENIGEVVKHHHHSTSDANIVREVKSWVEDPKFTRTRETNHFKMVETYWMVKTMVA